MEPEARMRRHWTINGRFLTQNVTGVQRYALEILQSLDELLSEAHPLADGLTMELLVPRVQVRLPALRAIGTRVAGDLTGHAWEQFTLPRHSRGGILSLCNTGPLVQRRHIVCIHDANTWTFPSSYSWRFRTFYRTVLPVLARRAALVATVSHSSAKCLADLRVADPERTVVIPNGHEHAHGWAPVRGSCTDQIGHNTIVVIGSPAPHKNVRLLLDLSPVLMAHGLQVAVIGQLDARVFGGAGAAQSASVVLQLGRVSDGELTQILQSCLCLAFPSFTEGFGLPPLEAMALGCPVVVSDRASLPEVCGDAALYASPEDPAAWLKAFIALRDDERLRSDLIAKGRVRSGGYSWRSSAELYLQAMAQVDRVSNIETRLLRRLREVGLGQPDCGTE
jgi:glycosyltransferase involved in cell wall biosynthesis